MTTKQPYTQIGRQNDRVYALRRLSGFLFLAVIIVGSVEAKRLPFAILVMGTCLIAAGLPTAIYGFRTLERYKNVFDYEPAEFWGKTRNGGEAREVLMG